jgi:hypothetical protein
MKCLQISIELIYIDPLVCWTSLVKLLKVVDLPAPFTPIKVKHSPAESKNLNPSTANIGWPLLQGP